MLKQKHFDSAAQNYHFDDNSRRKAVRRFLTCGLQKLPPTKKDFAAYGQASLLMAERIVDLLKKHQAQLFASMIPRGCKPPKNFQHADYLRKDHIFMQERFFYFLEQKQEHGLFVMDQTEKQLDKRFVKRLQNYYTKTQVGIERTQWIVPVPLFVDSEMSVGVQAADLCLYCINWGFRLHYMSSIQSPREDIAQRFGARLNDLQFRGSAYRDGETHKTSGIVFVADPFESRNKGEK